MLTGRLPFVADMAVAVVSQHINAAPVAPSELQLGLPRTIERLVMQLLAKAPEDRPQTAAEVFAALEAIA
jgi:serine/threonine-protein kinase